MMPLYPLRLKPIYKRYLWGGRRFETILGRNLEPGDDYAESWEVADHTAGLSVVESGPLEGTPLGALVRQRGEDLLGRHHPQGRFPLLLKYLDARRRLSVQVHPDDECAARMGLSDSGKSEAWVVVSAEPGGVLWAGLNRPLDRPALGEAIRRGTLEQCLHRCEPAAGDCFYLPAGTVHALGEGLLVAEIQTPSDVTFRLDDWGRLGPDGKPRPLHIEQGLEAIRLPQGPVAPQKPQRNASGGERLVECEKFVLDRWRLASPREIAGDGRCHVLTVVQGSVAVEGDALDRPASRGQTIVLPASVGVVRITPQSAEPAVLLDAFLP